MPSTAPWTVVATILPIFSSSVISVNTTAQRLPKSHRTTGTTSVFCSLGSAPSQSHSAPKAFSSRAAAVIAFEEVPSEEVIHYGIAKPRGALNEVFELADLIEKPDVSEAPSNLAIAARYVFSPAIFDCLEKTPPGKGDEIQLTDAIRMLIRQGRKVLGVRLTAEERRFDIGNFESYFLAFAEFAMADPQYGPALREHVAKLLEDSAGK